MAIRNMDKITFDGDQIKFPASAILQEDLEGDISELKEDFKGFVDGKEYIDASWANGSLYYTTGEYYAPYIHRICTLNIVHFTHLVTYTISSGYVLMAMAFNSDGTKKANFVEYTNSVTFRADTYWKFVIRKSTEDTSVRANVVEFKESVFTDSLIKEMQDDIAEISIPVSDYLKLQNEDISFASHAIDSTYQVEWFDCDIAVGESVQIEIVCPNNDVNTSYLNFNDADNIRLNPSALYAGTATRTVTFTNGYAKAVAKIGLTLVKVNAQNSYTVLVYKTTNLPRRVSALENEVDAIEDVLENVDVVPSYFQTQLATAIASAQTNMLNAGINGETFVFISDIHWESNQKHSPVLIGEVNKALNIENTIFGGDAINGGTQAQTIANMNEIRQKFESNSKRFLSIFGNHDSNAQDGGVVFTNREFYTLLQKQNDYDVTYIYPYFYYMDNPATKTRMIFLDTGMTNPSNPTAEMTWLQNAVSGVSNGWHILVFAHVIYTPSGGDYGDPSTYQMTTFMTDVCTYLDSINTAGQKTVDAIFGGHCHLDYNSTSTGGIPIIMIDTDSSQTESAEGATTGTIKEQCFDIVTVNYTSKSIKCTRVGRGQDRTISYS